MSSSPRGKIIDSTQPDTFYPFPRLPTELRLRIWSIVQDIEPPRKLRFSYHCAEKRQRVRELEGCLSNLRIVWPQNDIPTILHICHESRNHALRDYSVGFEVDQSPSLIARGIHKALEECSYEEALGKKGRGFYWNTKKDLMWIDSDWLDDNLKAFLWDGQFDVKFPNLKWLVFDETALIYFVQDRAISWQGIETVFVIRESGSPYSGSGERLAWMKKFGRALDDKSLCANEVVLPELEILPSWDDILKYLKA